MRFVAAVCPHCEGELQVPHDHDSVKCMYCGEDIVVRHAIKPVHGKTRNLFDLAQAALAAGNNDEAIGYFNKVLEDDPTNCAAWVGKGTAAGWSSTLNNLRLSEMLVAFQNALGHSDVSEEADIRRTCAHTINEVAIASYSLARNHMLEFVALEGTWQEYLSRCRQIVSALEVASAYAPDDKQILENLIYVCKDNIEGVKYRDPYDNNISKSVFLAEAYESELRTLMSDAAAKVKHLDPTYVAPEAKRPSSGCFVVTATLGRENHPSVSLLRSFRDEYLQSSRLGRAFIQWYYQKGPRIARQIEDSWIARLISYLLVVVPAVTLVRLYYAFTSRNGSRSRGWRNVAQRRD
jgi:tetratricopeptide (TPR) repeat protein